MYHKSIPWSLFVLFLSATVFVGKPSASFLYDDFSGSRLDARKWTNQQTTFTEMVREVAGGKLISKIANHPNQLTAQNNTPFRSALTIHTVECEVTIEEAIVDTGEDPESFARLNGFFYNSQSGGGAAGDVWAGVHIGNRGGGLEAWWEVSHALSDDGSQFEVVGSGTIEAGTLHYGHTYTVKLAYDGVKTFTFTVAGTSVVSAAGPARQRGPVRTFKGLTTGAYGFAGASAKGYASASFDNVYVNNTIYDTFDGELSNALWATVETVLETESGRLRLNQQGFDGQSQTTAYLSDADAGLVAAKVRILSGSHVSPGANGILRIQGYYYNEIRGPGSGLPHNGFEGDVFAFVRLQMNPNGSLFAAAYVGRSNSADENAWSDIAYHAFSTPVSFNTDYTLSIEDTGGSLIFRCNAEAYTYPVTTARYKPFGQHRGFRTRLYLDPGESGYLRALVDDVHVDTCPYASGDEDYCSICGPCSEGQGDCDSDAECSGGLFCIDGAGPVYGLPDGADVCDFQDIAYVEPEGFCGGDNDPCYAGIQEAIDGAFEIGKIKVAAGSYHEAIVLGKSGVRLEFSWDDAFTTLSQAGPAVLWGPAAP